MTYVLGEEDHFRKDEPNPQNKYLIRSIFKFFKSDICLKPFLCPKSQSENFCALRVIDWTGLIFILSATLFLIYPEIDLFVAGLLHKEGGSFYFLQPGMIEATRMARWGLHTIFMIAVIAAAALFIFSHFKQCKTAFGISQKVPLYFLLTFALGPGLLTNVTLKDNWGRNRPHQVVEFGGSNPFTPPLLIAGNCKRNCSFVCGEASTIFILFASLAMIIRRWRRQLLFAGLAMGLIAGIVRMGAGGHFLSDVIFAGLFMNMTALLVYYALFGARDKSSPLGNYMETIPSWPITENLSTAISTHPALSGDDNE